jgi:hypothetical protein
MSTIEVEQHFIREYAGADVLTGADVLAGADILAGFIVLLLILAIGVISMTAPLSRIQVSILPEDLCRYESGPHGQTGP